MRDGIALARARQRDPGSSGWLRLLALLLACNLLALAVAARARGAEPLARAVASVGMTVSDADRAADFYARVLGFERLSDVELAGPELEALTGVFGARVRVVALGLGRERLELTEFVTPRGRPIPADARSNDLTFQHVAIVVRDMDEAYRRLRAQRVEHVSTSPQTLPDWNPDAGGIRAFYFRDPDGHTLELIWFPPGRGDPRWQAAGGELFLGIDHTAIAVRDSEASLAFYRDRLGLAVAGASENWGTEQEHLNQVFGARLRITGLRAAEGPGIELLEYLTPRDGRPAPDDLRPNDLVHWETTLRVRHAPDAAASLRAARARAISTDVVALPGRALGFGRAFAVRDPDGHALRLAEP
jgi:catechol 2,3-dioxygenase-like lactoylglutathione lyase family enzyme